MNLENSQHNQIKKMATANAMSENLKKKKNARLTRPRAIELFEKKTRFFNYKADPTESIDEVCSNPARMQMMIRDIKKTESPTDLDVALILTLINSIEGEAYKIASPFSHSFNRFHV